MFVHRVLTRTAVALATMALAALGLVVPAAAHGAVEVSAEKGVLLIRSDGPDLNVVDVRFNGFVYQVWDATPGLTAGAGCLVTDLGRAICTSEVGSASIEGSDGADVIDLSGVPVPVDGDGGAGDDALNGGALRTTLTGGPGIDGLVGSPRDDRLTGGEGDDLLIGRDGEDVEFGGDDNDILEGGAGSGDTLAGNAGDDLLDGGPGDDTLQGDSGADVLVGGLGRDSLMPGSGRDAVFTKDAGDELQCPVRINESDAPPAPCAVLRSGATPDVWPPFASADPRRPTADAAVTGPNAIPYTPGRANYVKVKIRAERERPVKVCIRTRNFQRRLLTPYTARTSTKYWKKIYHPSPPERAFFARARRGACGG